MTTEQKFLITWATALALVLALLALSGCTQPTNPFKGNPHSQEDLIGWWENSQGDWMMFRADGFFNSSRQSMGEWEIDPWYVVTVENKTCPEPQRLGISVEDGQMSVWLLNGECESSLEGEWFRLVFL